MDICNKTCARCKKGYSKLSASVLIVSKSMGTYGFRELDMCPKCKKDLELFMNNAPIFKIGAESGGVAND